MPQLARLACLIFSLICSLASGQIQSLALDPLLTGLSRPTAIANAGDGSGRLFLVEQNGRVLVYSQGSLMATPFLNVSGQIICCGERGLLGIAFHPDYASNGEFFVNYTNTLGDTVISRFQVSGNANVAAPSSQQILLTVDQPFSNHNGGQLAFGPDGYLYIGLGDGGSGGDPQDNAQDPQSLLGKMLRIDVDSGSPYSIPADNPFVDDDFTRDEIWALGLRNPFRYSFDAASGDLFIADVGQDAIEEINIHRAGSAAGVDYGWRLMEGSECFNPVNNCNDGSLTLPAFQYSHGQGRCSVTGGYVYRGASISTLRGDYIYGDFCSGEIFVASQSSAEVWSQSILMDTSLQISSFGETEAGEILVAGIGGGIYALIKPLDISPGSGVYFQSQFIDLGLALRVDNVSINTVSLTINGVDVTPQFNGCAINGQLNGGGLTRRCPDLPLTLLAPGDYELVATLTLSDGSVVSDSVNWTILANTE